MGFIYKIEGPINLPNENKIYVGLTTTSLTKRWQQHVANYNAFINNKLCGTDLYKAIKKYNIDNFKISSIEECDINIITDREIYWIKELNSRTPYGYNIRSGGEFHNHSDDTKHLMSQLKKNNESKHLPDYINYNIRDDNPNNIRHGYNVFYVPANKRIRIEVPINQPLNDDMLIKAKAYLQEFIDNHNNPKKNLENVSIIPKPSFKQSEKSISLELFINYYDNGNKNKKATRHGYIVRHTPSKTSKVISIPINDPITSDMLELAKKYKQQFIDNHNNIMLEKQIKNLKI